MGVNAQTTVPTFTAAQVLTADQMNQSARTGVPVFANTTDRDAAFGGSGEKTLAEGQLAYIENIAGSAAVQHYDGAAWQTLVSSGLNFITGTSFSAVASVSLPNGTFTSTYANYRVIIFITANSTDETAFTLRMRASGTDDATGYYGAFFGVNNAADTLRVVRSSNATGFALGTLRTTTLYDQAYCFDVINPQVANITNWTGTATGVSSVAANDFGAFSFGGAENSTTQFDALSFFPAAGSITGTYRVYGYSDS